MHDERLRTGRVFRSETGPTRGSTNHQRHFISTAVHKPPHTGLKEDFISGSKDEVSELQFDDWPQPHRCRADPGTDHDVLGDRRIEDPLWPEAVPQTFSDLEDSAPDGDILAVENYVLVTCHLFG